MSVCKLKALCAEVVHRGWLSVVVSDFDGTALSQNTLDQMYRALCGPTRLDNYDHEFFVEAKRSQRWHLEAQSRDLISEHGFSIIYKWLGTHARLMPGLVEFVSALGPKRGLVILSNNFDCFIKHILETNGLDVPFLGNVLCQDGSVETIHEEDGLNKALVCQALVSAGIMVDMVAGDSKGDRGMAEFAHHMGVPVLCFGNPKSPGDLGDWCAEQGIQARRLTDWRDATPLISPLELNPR